MINAFAQTVATESHTLARRIITPFCQHYVNSFQVSSCRNWTLLWRQLIHIFRGQVSYSEQCFILLEAMDKYKKNTERSLKFTAEVTENVTRRLEAGESKRSVAEDLGVPESTLRKWLKTGTVPTSLGRLKATFSSDEEKELADYCRDLDARFYGVTIRMLSVTAFIIDLTKKRRLLERTGWSIFAKDRIYQLECLKNAALEEL